jgi:uncharacterized OB-fold protein
MSDDVSGERDERAARAQGVSSARSGVRSAVSGASRPTPVPDEWSAPFWKAAARHQLTAAACSACGAFSIPPDVVCPHCGDPNAEFSFRPLSGRGAVRSWTVMHQSSVPGFDDALPFVLVDVELDDQADLRMIARLLDGRDVPVTLDDRVTSVFEDIAPGVAIPAFVRDRAR